MVGSFVSSEPEAVLRKAVLRKTAVGFWLVVAVSFDASAKPFEN